MKKLGGLMENWKKLTVETITLLLMILFTYAGVSKLFVFSEFRTQLEQFPFLGEYSGSIAWGLPVVLILIPFLFFSDRFKIGALYASFFLFVLFSLYIIAVLNFAESIPCSCSGIIPSLSWGQHLIFNVACALLTAIGIFFSHDIEIRNQKISFSKKGIRL